MEYDDNIGIETIYDEYKSFNFYNIGLELTNEDASYLIENKKWIFNENIIKNIKSMIKLYLPKYTCAYLSNKLDKECSLYFGIDDCGTVSGIPYQGEIDKKIIQEYLKEILLNNVKSNFNIYNYISFEIIKILYINNFDIFDIQHYYKDYIYLK